MTHNDFNNDRKFCPTCNDYVSYLSSIEHSFCTTCGGKVRLFSEEDWTTFNTRLDAKRPKGGRPRTKRRATA